MYTTYISDLLQIAIFHFFNNTFVTLCIFLKSKWFAIQIWSFKRESSPLLLVFQLRGHKVCNNSNFLKMYFPSKLGRYSLCVRASQWLKSCCFNLYCVKLKTLLTMVIFQKFKNVWFTPKDPQASLQSLSSRGSPGGVVGWCKSLKWSLVGSFYYWHWWFGLVFL